MITDQLFNTIKCCALKEYPNELIGCVVGGRFIQLENVSSKKTEQYRLSPKDKVMLFELGDSLDALVHSHPHLNNDPSDFDIKSQKACGFPFWIIGTNGEVCTEIKEVSYDKS